MTPLESQRRTQVIALALILLCASVGCSRTSDPPVATPTVTIQESRAPRGRPIDVHYRFTVAPDAPPFAEGYTVFVHALDAHGNRVWTSDHQPPTPVTEWKARAVVEYTRPMMVPRAAPLGPVTLQVGLYSPSTGKRLPLSGTETDRRAYRVASLEVIAESRSESEVLFGTGWYAAEAPEDAQGVEWRWSKRTAVLLTHNPRRDATLVLDVDQPIDTGSGPQSVEIQSGGARIGSFMVGKGERALHRFPVSAAQLGTGDTVRFALSVDRTFTPSHLPGSSNKDERELGIRVFSASLEPVSQASSKP